MPDSISPFDRPLTHKSFFNIVYFSLISLKDPVQHSSFKLGTRCSFHRDGFMRCTHHVILLSLVEIFYIICRLLFNSKVRGFCVCSLNKELLFFVSSRDPMKIYLYILVYNTVNILQYLYMKLGSFGFSFLFFYLFFILLLFYTQHTTTTQHNNTHNTHNTS